MPFESIPHTADIGFKIWSSTLEELFSEAAKALTFAMVETGSFLPAKQNKIRLKAESKEELLVRWLEEILFLFETENFIGLEFKVKLKGNGLEGLIEGMEWDEAKQPLKTQIKAVTFHRLEVRETENGFEAEVILDV